ncbi:MAG: hypothetical protein LUF35_13320 [Lachnospiraceae bacterium]|nr:hypothetical protein [Lachnospiraceae bacterium]
MKINPMKLMQLRGMEDQVKNSHPKLDLFFAAASAAVDEGTIVEVKMTTSTGETLRTNIRVNADDMEMIKKLKEAVE